MLFHQTLGRRSFNNNISVLLCSRSFNSNNICKFPCPPPPPPPQTGSYVTERAMFLQQYYNESISSHFFLWFINDQKDNLTHTLPNSPQTQVLSPHQLQTRSVSQKCKMRTDFLLTEDLTAKTVTVLLLCHCHFLAENFMCKVGEIKPMTSCGISFLCHYLCMNL